MQKPATSSLRTSLAALTVLSAAAAFMTPLLARAQDAPNGIVMSGDKPPREPRQDAIVAPGETPPKGPRADALLVSFNIFPFAPGWQSAPLCARVNPTWPLCYGEISLFMTSIIVEEKKPPQPPRIEQP